MLTTLSSLVATAPVAEEKRQTSVLALPLMTFTGTFPRPIGAHPAVRQASPSLTTRRNAQLSSSPNPGQEPSRDLLEPSRVPPVSQTLSPNKFS